MKRDNINEAVLNEAILKEAASLYVSREGESLLRELASLENAQAQNFGEKMRKRVKGRVWFNKIKKTAFIAGPVAACLIVALLVSRDYGIGGGSASTDSASSPPIASSDASAEPSADLPSTAAPPEPSAESPTDLPNTPAEQPTDTAVYARAEIEFLSSKLPDGCVLVKTDYDREKTIYYITNDRNNDIVLVTEPTAAGLEEFDTESFDSIDINGKRGYVLAKKDYKTLLVQTDDMRLTFTSRFNTGDLIKIAQALI